jgi:WD40 repeat protein
LWDVETGKLIRVLDQVCHKEERCACLNTDGKMMATGGSNGYTAKLWDVETGEMLRVFEGHSGRVWSVSLSHDSKRLVTGSEDETARMWDVETGNVLHVFEHPKLVSSVFLSGDGKLLATGSLDYTARMWDVETGDTIKVFPGHHKNYFSYHSMDDRFLKIGYHSGTFSLWNIDTGERIRSFEGDPGSVTKACLAHDARFLVTINYDFIKGSTLRLWDVDNGEIFHILRGHRDDCILSVSLSADARLLVTGSQDNTARLWDVRKGKLIRVFEGHFGAIESVSLSADARLLVTGSRDNTARLWDIEDGRIIRIIEGVFRVPGTHSDDHSYGHSVCLSPDGRLLLTVTNRVAQIWDVAKGRRIRILYPSQLGGFCTWTNDGRFLVDSHRMFIIGTTRCIARILDTTTGKVVHTLKHLPDLPVLLSEESRILVVEEKKWILSFWDVKTGELLVRFYSLDDGFLWTTPPTEDAPSGWFWTNRPDLITVMQCDEDGSNPRILGTDDPVRQDYLRIYNNQAQVMIRINPDNEEYRKAVTRLQEVYEDSRLKEGTKIAGQLEGTK